MKILVTGATGFIGRHLSEHLTKVGHVVLAANSNTSFDELSTYLEECDFVYHLAATHRPKEIIEFQKVNVEYFQQILNKLATRIIKCPVVFTSSIQAGNGSGYGDSKEDAEQILQKYQNEKHGRIHILRLTNTFGKFAKPNHTSVVATFCYNISHGIPIVINDPIKVISFCYIDDVINQLVSYLYSKDSSLDKIIETKITRITVGKLAELIRCIADEERIDYPDVNFVEHLRDTYFWYRKI